MSDSRIEAFTEFSDYISAVAHAIDGTIGRQDIIILQHLLNALVDARNNIQIPIGPWASTTEREGGAA